MYFLDTNILLYAGSQAAADHEKKQAAIALIRGGEFALSAQVLQEFVVNAVGKKELGLTEENVARTLESLRAVRVLPITHELVETAWALRKRFRISYWDAAIIAAAKERGCDMVYSEDLNHGQVYDGVKVINPFV